MLIELTKESFALIAGIHIIPYRIRNAFGQPAHFDLQTFEWQTVRQEKESARRFLLLQLCTQP
jgi:hypothetical protein